jgi:N-acetylmuramoyl-L-alanine amidase
MSVYYKGSFGETVGDIQRMLGIEVTGQFGERTDDAVRQFQANNGLVVDGIVGPETLKKMGLKFSYRRKVDTISVHCSATKEGNFISVANIRRWHKDRGWSDIGYHYVIYLDGSIHRGRPLYKIPAAVKHHNAHMAAVCYIGGIDRDMKPKDTRTDAQKRSLWRLLTELRNKYPHADIRGHRDYPHVHKACPSFDAFNEYLELT